VARYCLHHQPALLSLGDLRPGPQALVRRCCPRRSIGPVPPGQSRRDVLAQATQAFSMRSSLPRARRALANEASGHRGPASRSARAGDHRCHARARFVLAGRALHVPVASAPAGPPRTTAVGRGGPDLRCRCSSSAGRADGTRLPSSGPGGASSGSRQGAGMSVSWACGERPSVPHQVGTRALAAAIPRAPLTSPLHAGQPCDTEPRCAPSTYSDGWTRS
jgi:hypothetical protein